MPSLNTKETCLLTKRLLDQQFTSDLNILQPPSQGELDQGPWGPQVNLSIYTSTSNPQTQYFGPSLSGRIVTEDAQWAETSMANGSNVCKLDILPQYNCQQYFDFVYHTQLKTFTHPIF